jgi:ABC-type transport system involved in multi-copper enzyme maturation permease subunit
LDVSGTAPVPFGRLVMVELRKSYDTRAGFWLLLSIGGVVGLFLAIATIITVVQDEPVRYVDFVAIAAYITGILLPILGIMLVTSEWSQRSAMVTFSLEPRRVNVVLAKMVVGVLLTALTLVAALVIGLVCTTVCEVANPDLTTWEVGADELAGFAVTQTLAMLGGFAIATLLLNTPASIVVFFVYRFVIPIVFGIAGALMDWFEDVRVWIDFQSAMSPIYDWSLSTGEEWGHFVVSGILWLGLPIGIGLWRILRAEVK